MHCIILQVIIRSLAEQTWRTGQLTANSAPWDSCGLTHTLQGCSTAYCESLCVCRESLIVTAYSFITKRGCLCCNDDDDHDYDDDSSNSKFSTQTIDKNMQCCHSYVWLASTSYLQKNSVYVCVVTYIHTCIGNNTFQISIHINKFQTYYFNTMYICINFT